MSKASGVSSRGLTEGAEKTTARFSKPFMSLETHETLHA